MRNLADKI